MPSEVGEVGHGLTREGLRQPRRPIAASGVQPREPPSRPARWGSGFRRSRGRIRFQRRAHPPRKPAARDLQAAADGAPVEHQDRVPEAFGSGMTINARLIARSTRVMMSSTTNSWALIRTLRITAGSGTRWCTRSRSSISSAPRPVGISRSFRRSSWDGTPSGYESISHSG
jgi:hypothetical protein